MPPKNAHSESMREWWKYGARDGFVAAETVGSAGYAHLGTHVDAARVLCSDDVRRRQDSAASGKWNRRHWRGDGCRHTDNIEDVATRFGRKRRLSDQEVRVMLDDIRLWAGGAKGWPYLASAELSGNAAAKVEAGSDALSLVALNVDGLGQYALPPADRMDAILACVFTCRARRVGAAGGDDSHAQAAPHSPARLVDLSQK